MTAALGRGSLMRRACMAGCGMSHGSSRWCGWTRGWFSRWGLGYGRPEQSCLGDKAAASCVHGCVRVDVLGFVCVWGGLVGQKTRGIEVTCGKFTIGASRVAELGDPLFMYYDPMDPCDHDMVKWHRRCLGSLDKIEHAELLGSLGSNGASDDPADFIPTGAPIDLEGHRSARSAVSSIQDLAWLDQAGAITSRSHGIFLGIALRGDRPQVMFS
ncbi:retinoblastoma-binding protein 5 [Dorcoceras hygrometricum]|uniref:Retinoblastoma-binding protein 5 n=1 Tax=Dorcoceras hygrometricum TaxID=472368 RepID=A0A2Z7BW29_9LAMI|nr:retinoblastoma-binding protein 5 [Dorcoceras hygrometricum]